MDSALEILAVLAGASLGVLVLISLAVMAAGLGPARTVEPGPVWLGGPGRGECGVGASGLVLTDGVPGWAAKSVVDWVAAADGAEPTGRTGGASAGW